MYIDLRTKLEMYKNNQPEKEKEIMVTGPDVDEILDGTVCAGESGSYFFIEKKYPLDYIHGSCALDKAVLLDYSVFSNIISGSTAPVKLSDLVFLDTETTGLSGGTGTVAFLIGAGFFENDTFVLRQYFMRDYDEEFPILKALIDTLSSRRAVVSFNGKAFDWNLLQTRYTSNRIRSGIKTPVHMDLLYPSRLLWKSRLENCRLSSIEENILKMKRFEDIPGSTIPSVYFKYLEDRNATEIKKVIHHNEKDILSLVTLAIKINDLLSNPILESKDSTELYGIGRIFEKREQYKAAEECYVKCITTVNTRIKELSLKRLAFFYKRNREFQRAAACLESILEFSDSPNILVRIELAKHYEHKVFQIQKALGLVTEAINICLKESFFKELYYDELKIRSERLNKKLKNLKANINSL